MAAAADRQQDFEAAVEQEQGQHIERLEEQVGIIWLPVSTF